MEHENEIKQVKRWREHPEEWDRFMWPTDPPSEQQEQAYQELGKLISAKIKKRDGLEMTEKEQDYAKKIGISIQSGKGTGKDAWVARVILFFLFNFPFPKIPCTANTNQQLKNVLWSEIAKWMQKSVKGQSGKPLLEELFEWQSEKIFRKTERGKRWFAEAVTVNVKASAQEQEHQAAAMAGRHEENLMAVVDEACGIADPVFSKLEETLTQSINFLILIFNPTRTKGYAIESQKDKRFISIRWNSEDSERVSKDHINALAEKYGKDSNPYRVGVLGLPPHSDQNTLIPYDWIMDAVERDIKPLKDDPLIFGVDCGAGGDKSIIAKRKGGLVYPLLRYNTKDTMVLVGHVSREIESNKPQATIVDNIGIGKGVYDRLREQHRRIHSGDIRRSAHDEQKFYQKRDELWWKLRDEFEKGTISIPNDSNLIDQLSAINWEPTSTKGQVKIQSKKEMRKVMDGSPDEADAVVLTYFYNDSTFRTSNNDDDDPDYKKKRKHEEVSSWMAA